MTMPPGIKIRGIMIVTSITSPAIAVTAQAMLRARHRESS